MTQQHTKQQTQHIISLGHYLMAAGKADQVFHDTGGAEGECLDLGRLMGRLEQVFIIDLTR